MHPSDTGVCLLESQICYIWIKESVCSLRLDHVAFNLENLSNHRFLFSLVLMWKTSKTLKKTNNFINKLIKCIRFNNKYW